MWDLLEDRVNNSLFLMAVASAISVPLSLFIGAYTALRRDKWFDRIMSNQLLVLAAMPEFVVGALLTVLLATNVWHLVPAVSRIRPGEPPWSDLDGLVLPVLTLVLAVTPHVGRTMRAAMIDVLESDYVEICLLYTSDAADERSSGDLGGRRIITKKQKKKNKREEVRRTT